MKIVTTTRPQSVRAPLIPWHQRIVSQHRNLDQVSVGVAEIQRLDRALSPSSGHGAKLHGHVLFFKAHLPNVKWDGRQEADIRGPGGGGTGLGVEILTDGVEFNLLIAELHADPALAARMALETEHVGVEASAGFGVTNG